MPLVLDNAAVQLSSLSKEFVKVRVTGERGGVDLDPTAYTVEFAFTEAATPATEPTAPDWVTGSWETDAGDPDLYYARCLVGPGSNAVLTNGTYDVWVRFDDTVEYPVRRAGRIIVT